MVCRCRYLTSVSVFGIFVGIFKSRFGIRYRYFAIIYNFWCNTATAMSVVSFHVHVAYETHYKRHRQLAVTVSHSATQCWGDVSSTLSGVNMSDNYRQLDHSQGPPRTARTNLRGRATTCMRYILSQQKCTCSCPAVC